MGSQADFMGLSFGFATGPGERRCVSPLRTQISDVSSEDALTENLLENEASHFQSFNFRGNDESMHQCNSGHFKTRLKDVTPGARQDEASAEVISYQHNDVGDTHMAIHFPQKQQYPLFRQESEVFNSDELFGPGELTGKFQQESGQEASIPVYSGNSVHSCLQSSTVVSVEGDKEQATPSFLSTFSSNQKQVPCEEPIPPFDIPATTSIRHSLHKARPRSYPCYENQQRHGQDGAQSLEAAGVASHPSSLVQITMGLKSSASTELGTKSLKSTTSAFTELGTKSLKSSASTVKGCYPTPKVVKTAGVETKSLKSSAFTKLGFYPSSSVDRTADVGSESLKVTAPSVVVSHLSSTAQHPSPVCHRVEGMDEKRVEERDEQRVEERDEQRDECTESRCVTRPSRDITGDEVDGHQQKIGLRPVVGDPLSTTCDALICLWSGHNVSSGEHPLVSAAGSRIHHWENFKHQLKLDQVLETKADNPSSTRLLHCKYDRVSRLEIADVIFKCIAYAEGKGAATIVFPLEYFDEFRGEPGLITEGLMIAISVTQKIHRNAQHLKKLIICVETEEKKRRCRHEFNSVRNKCATHRKCQNCEDKTAVRLQPVSRGPCTRECAVFCMPCLKQAEQCQQHGPCLPPIGHENSFAILVSGYDRKVQNARVFKEETRQMSRLLLSPEHVGLREDNVWRINPRRCDREQGMMSRIQAAFRDVKKRVCRTKHSSFYFYFSGHNTTGLVLGGPGDILTPRDLKKEFYRLKVDEIMSVLDCCYSGGSGLTQQLDSEDFTTSMCSLEGLDSLMYLPRLWNLQQDQRSPTAKVTRIYQLSSSVASEKSYLRDKKSVFTDALISIVLGDCPLKKNHECKHCEAFRRRTERADGIFLSNLHASLLLHVGLLESQQHPELGRNDDSDILFAYSPPVEDC